jgi:hypothetical protein
MRTPQYELTPLRHEKAHIYWVQFDSILRAAKEGFPHMKVEQNAQQPFMTGVHYHR